MTEIDAERLANMRRICTLSDEFICGFLAHDDRWHAERAGAKVSEAEAQQFCDFYVAAMENGWPQRTRAALADFLARRRVVAQRRTPITIHIAEHGLTTLLHGDGASWTGIPDQPDIHLKLSNRDDVLKVLNATLATHATATGLVDTMANLANSVYIDLSASGPACPCGNGRVPTGAYRAAVDAYAAAIRRLATPQTSRQSAEAEIPEGARESAAQDATALHVVPEPDIAALAWSVARIAENAGDDNLAFPFHELCTALVKYFDASSAHHRAEAARRQQQGEAWEAVDGAAQTMEANADAGSTTEMAWRALADLAREMGK